MCRRDGEEVLLGAQQRQGRGVDGGRFDHGDSQFHDGHQQLVDAREI